MPSSEEINAIFDRILAGQATEVDIHALRLELQQGKYRIEAEQLNANEIHIGDRIYHGADAEALRRILREILAHQTDLETIKQALREVLRSSASRLPTVSPAEEKEAVCQFLRSVYERFSSVEFLHRRGEKVALCDQYIPIQVTLDKQPEKSSAGRYLGYVESEAELQRAYALKKEDDKREQIDWQEARKKHQRIMVLADPGMGKTTLLRMEAGTLAEQEQQALVDGSKTLGTVMLPVWLRLSNLAEQVQQATDTVLEAILKLVKAEWDDQQFTRLQPALEAKLRKGQCLLLLDALDEVPRQLRDRLSEKLNDFAGNYSCPIICTSRIVGYTSLLKGVTQVEIVPFRQEQTRIYIEKWFTNAADTLNKTGDETVSAKNLIHELKSKPQIQGLAMNPLLLSLICSLYQEKGITLPARRGQVYAKAVEYMLEKWSRSSKKQTRAKLQAKTRLLEYLAYQFTCDGVEIFSEDQLYIKLSEYLEDSKIPAIFRKFETDDPIEELAAEDGILQKLSEKDYLFFHRTFQEYFTASYLVRAGKEGIQLTKAHLWNFEWHETISLMAGLMEEPLGMIQEILNEKDDIFHTQLLLAGRCLADCKESINPFVTRIITDIINRIYHVWSRYPDAEFIESVVVIIGKANLDKSGDFNKFLDDGRLHREAARVLGKIGSPKTVLVLSQALQNIDYQDQDNITHVLEVVYALSEFGSLAIPALFQALQSSRSIIREDILFALCSISTVEVLPAIQIALQDRNDVLRVEAARALGKIDIIDALPTIQMALQSEDFNVIESVAWVIESVAWGALSKVSTSEAIPVLLQALQHEDFFVREKAAEALGKIGTSEAIPALIRCLKDEQEEVIDAAVEALGKINSSVAVPSLLEALLDKTNSVRWGAVRALCALQATEAVPNLLETLQDEDKYVREDTAWTLGKLQATEAVPALLEATQDEDSQVRSAALRALSKINPSAALSPLLEALDDEDKEVKRNAVWALGELQATEAVPALLKATQDEDSQVRSAALRALSKINPSAALSPLLEALDDEDKEVKRNAVWALGKLQATEAVPALLKATQDEDSQVRSEALGALSKINPSAALSPLLEALDDEDKEVRRNVVRALGRLQATEAVPALLEALDDEDMWEAIQVLSEINPTEEVFALQLQLLEDILPNLEDDELAKICETHAKPKVVLTRLLESPTLAIHRKNNFSLIRQLAIRVSREDGDCVPIYAERVRSLQ